MAALVTLDIAKDELRIVTDEENAQLERIILQASEFVIDYLKDQADPLWDAETVPAAIQAGVLDQVHIRYERDPDKAKAWREHFEWHMSLYRDPTLA